jgi:2-polyprenyl-3-methyl-5-hydroxy-6-metoxy-1,4-benzoquinol methylase
MFETLQKDLCSPSATAVLDRPAPQTSRQDGNHLSQPDAFARLYSIRRKARFPKKRRSRRSQSLPSARNESLYNHFHDLLKTHLVRGRSSRILEVGCGSGKFCHTLVEYGYQTYGVDQSHVLLQQARQIAPGCEFERGSVYESYQDLFLEQFEAVVYLESIEHLVSPQRFIQTAAESLSAGGLLIVSARYRGCLMNLTSALTGRCETDETERGIPNNSPTTLKTLLQNSGLEIVHAQGRGCIPHHWRSQLFVARKPQNH